jgi:hypothetical protein
VHLWLLLRLAAAAVGVGGLSFVWCSVSGGSSNGQLRMLIHDWDAFQELEMLETAAVVIKGVLFRQ